MYAAAVFSTPKFRTSCYPSFHFFQAHFHAYMMMNTAGNFRGRKVSRIGEKYDFRGEIFRGLRALVPR